MQRVICDIVVKMVVREDREKMLARFFMVEWEYLLSTSARQQLLLISTYNFFGFFRHNLWTRDISLKAMIMFVELLLAIRPNCHDVIREKWKLVRSL